MLDIEHHEKKIKDQYPILISESNNVTKGTIIHLHGLPGGPASDNQNLHKLLATRGYRVVSFNYPGLWKVEGTFSIDSAIQSYKEIYDYVQNQFATSIKVFAESFGGTIAVIGLTKGITPSHIFYRAPLPGLEYFVNDEKKIQQLMASIGFLMQAGIVKLENNTNIASVLGSYDMDTSFKQKFSSLLENREIETRHSIITGKNDEILDYRRIKDAFEGAEIEIYDNLSHNNISRDQWIEIITRLDIFYQS